MLQRQALDVGPGITGRDRNCILRAGGAGDNHADHVTSCEAFLVFSLHCIRDGAQRHAGFALAIGTCGWRRDYLDLIQPFRIGHLVLLVQ